ncbi:MAG: peptidylprolyl isomerase [Flavobacteriales bacterium]|nr:peptidylprolyl isomerase [Flavobacteriales bacterium]
MKWVPIDRSVLAWVASLLASTTLVAQPEGELIDGIVGVVGREVVLYSDVVDHIDQLRQANETVDQASICAGFEDMLYEKLLLDQARLDSVTVDGSQVEAELERRVRYFVMQLGSQEKLEEFYGKTITEIKAEFYDQVHDQLLVQTMQGQVAGEVRVTPRQVDAYFNALPEDSLPFINAQVQFAQILREPRVSEEEDRRVRRKIEEFRESIVKGEKDFCTLAILYSEDPGSAKDCGELGLVPTGVMVPEFDAVALSLKEGEVSQVFKTQYGYHFMQLIERRGQQYNARHILIKPKVSTEDLLRAKDHLDSLATLIRAGKLDFGTAAVNNSDDEESRNGNGIMIDPNTGDPKWAMGDLDQQTFFVIDKLDVGQISEPAIVVLPDGSKAYRLIRLLTRTGPHRANLTDDYQLFQQAAERRMKQKMVDDWVKEKLGGTYVRVDPGYATCPFTHDWLQERP